MYVYVWRNTEEHSPNCFYRGKVIYVTYSECVFVALVIQFEMHMRLIVSVECLVLPIFFHIAS